MVIFTGAAVGALVGLRCPACGEIQARARAPEGTVYACRKCGHELTREPSRERADERRKRR